MAMMMSQSASLFALLVERSGLTNEEVGKKVEDKKESLGHFVNEDVAVRLVARDLGIKLHDETLEKPLIKIADLIPGINNLTLEVRVERCGKAKEFTKKDGTTGKMVRISVEDETGRINMVLWDDHANLVSSMFNGARLKVIAAYTREGLDGKVEIHLGNRGSIQIFDVKNDPQSTLRGRIERVYDPIYFSRRDGSEGRLVAFLLKNGGEENRVLVWGPSDEMLMSLVEGAYTEVLNGVVKKDLRGETEVHINNEADVRIDLDDVVPPKRDCIRLDAIQPEMRDIVIQGIVESDFEVETTYNGKAYARVLIKDGESVLPVVFWNGQALRAKQLAKPGSALIIEGCNVQFGKSGLEIAVSKWSRLRAK